jgi:glycosyltransferase involved in cell wall biosynthesis
MHEILIDVTRLLGRFMKSCLPTGVARVEQEYVRHYAHRSRALVRIRGRSIILPHASSGTLFKLLLGPATGFRSSAALCVGRELLRRRQGAVEGAFLFNAGHGGLARGGYADELGRLGVKPMFFVHDLIPITHPEYCRPGERDKHIARMNTVLKDASGVIANSRSTLEELAIFATKTGRPMPPATAALPAPATLPTPASRRPHAKPYFVVLGTIDAHKNHRLLLQVWRKLHKRMGNRTPRLLVIGQRGWESENLVDMLDRCTSLRSVVTELPRCSDQDLSTYLHHAQALLCPSFAEGYGMSLAEALKLGTPVIASDLQAFREIAGTVPDYLDPLDGIGWTERIEAYSYPAFSGRLAQLQRIHALDLPTWPRHFARVDALLEQLQENPA